MSVRATAPDVFTYQCSETMLFACSKKRVYDALHDIEAWPQHLPHVLDIDVLYDDRQYQEFLMEVDSKGSIIKVRSVRNCQEDQIEFFQPKPPVFLRHHAGIWEFCEVGPSSSEVTITHMWNLKDEVARQRFAPTSESTTEEQVQKLLQEHSKLALQTWKQILEPSQELGGNSA